MPANPRPSLYLAELSIWLALAIAVALTTVVA